MIMPAECQKKTSVGIVFFKEIFVRYCTDLFKNGVILLPKKSLHKQELLEIKRMNLIYNLLKQGILNTFFLNLTDI